MICAYVLFLYGALASLGSNGLVFRVSRISSSPNGGFGSFPT